MTNVDIRRAMLLAALVCSVALTPSANADGTETLGPFAGLADGNGIVGNGIGLCELPGCNGAGTERLIEFTVPVGVTVEQVLLYWNGFHTLEGNGDDTLEADGVEVTGAVIGGPFFFFVGDNVDNFSTTYRADITDLGLVSDGFNSVEITGADFDIVANGASIVVVYDDGSETEIQLVDGQDLAYCSDGSPEDGCPAFPPPRDNTVTQTFTFANPSIYDRQAELTIFAGSVEGPVSSGDPERPNVARLISGGVIVDVGDPLASNNEDEWDHVVIPVTIPANATDLSIQMLSAYSFEGDERQPASFNWVGSTLSVPEPFCGDDRLDPGETCDPPGSPAGPNDNLCREDCTVCGDEILDSGEECDDGNSDNNDGCRNDCTVPRCGDEMLDPGETCDPPGSPAGASGNLCRDDCTVCGDEILDNGEECDDGNDIDDDGCRNDCTVPRCGDEILDPGETCDPPGTPAGASGNLCRDDCTVCGDEILDNGEECDDGNDIDDDGCRNDCTVPRCGDEILDPGETCDPPGTPAGASGNLCRDDCTVCGDEILDNGEECDDGNDIDDDGCRNDCTVPRCGDEILDPGETCDPPGTPAGASGNLCRDDCTVCGDEIVDSGEECDDGNDVNDDGCRNDCTMPRCGDRIIDDGETCDPPGQPAGGPDECRNDCTYCGDGNLDASEECDDGNNDDGDGCDATCLIEPFCGDGDINQPDETCDPPGQPAGAPSECRDDCTYCGDGNLDPDTGEECDDGNNVDGDGCDAFCVVESFCGDEIVDEDFGETCDPPGSPAGNNGNQCRDDCTSCGDGNLDAGEECDDGNGVNTDTCRNNCTVPVCGDTVVDMQNGETCDPPGSAAGASGNTCRGDCTVCGDGNLNAGEECDDGNNVSGDGCENDCSTTPFCGDGEVNLPGETCDPPGEPAGQPNECRENCTSCGDGNLDPSEECDDGNNVDGDGCDAMCNIEPFCGDGEVNQPDETCDPPGEPAGQPNECREDCTSCGDGSVDSGEECDDGNNEDGDGCDATCNIEPFCGDGEVNQPDETCDPPGEPMGQPDECRDDCTYCGDGNIDRGEECDDGNNDDGDGCDATCFIETPCDIEVSKTCFVPDDGDDDDDDDDCRGKVLGMKLEYTGAGCGVLTNPQGGKAACLGGTDGAEPVSIRISDDRGDRIYGDNDVVLLGDIVEATAANADEDKFGSQTDVVIDDGLEEVTFHTSCSQSLRVGDQFGSVRLVELTTTEGGVRTLPDEDPDPAEGQQECVISPVPTGEHCDGKVKVLTMQYLGGSCSDSVENQGDKFSCAGDAGMTQPVRVVCEDYLDTGEPASVYLGDLVSIAAANAGDTTLSSQTDCAIYDEFGNWVQDVSFHTSCSKPIDLGNRFGSLEVFSMDTTGGGFIGLGQNVIYTYKITNNSDLPAVNVTVVDDQLGPVPGSPIPFIAPHGMAVLQTNVLISEDTTNIVTVNAELENGAECPEASDFAIVLIEDPPMGIEECTSKVKATLLTYIGPDIAGPVTIEAIGRSGGDPAVYEYPDGLLNGTTVSSPEENDFTIDATTRGETDLGSKMTITINGIDEVHHTSCSTPYISGLPAPLDNPKGDPSPNWFVEAFTQKN